MNLAAVRRDGDGYGRLPTLRLLPALAGVVVAVAVAIHATQSPLGSESVATIALVAAIVLVAVAATAALALGHDRVALVLGALCFPAGMVGFALGPQLWIVGALLVLASTVEETALAAALLVVIGALLALTIATLSWYRAVGAALALLVFLLAAGSTLLARSRSDPV